MRIAIVSLVASALAASNVAAQPLAPMVTWSEVTGQSPNKLAKDRVAAVIRRVDGRYALGEAKLKIQPGEHDVVVQSPPRHGFGGTERHYRLKVEPCRRYYVNAQFRSATGTDWDPVVSKSEPIIGCQLPPLS
jgi:hypothetical protein